MNTWIAIVVLLVAVAAVAMMRERWRLRAIDQWAGARGLMRRFPVPADGPQPAAALVRHLTIHGARLWGTILEGTLDGVAVTIAEHESSVPGRKTGHWHTIMTWPATGESGRIVIKRGRSSAVLADAAEAVIAAVQLPPGAASADSGLHTVETPGGWVIGGEAATVDHWLTPEKTRDLDAWPHGGTFVREGGSAAWRMSGNIATDTLQRIQEGLPVARRLLG